MRLQLHKIYKVVDHSRTFYVEVVDEMSNWEYDYNTYKCRILNKNDMYNQTLILVTEFWTITEPTSLELELL